MAKRCENAALKMRETAIEFIDFGEVPKLAEGAPLERE